MKIFVSLFLFLAFFVDAQDIAIYRLTNVSIVQGVENAFVSLTDRYRFSEYPDSAVIEEKYVGETSIDNENYHVLKPKYRKRFLERMGLDENDNVYFFHLPSDSVFSFPVLKLKLIAFLTPYGTYQPIPQTDYMIGFEFSKSQLNHQALGSYYSNTLVFVGPGNPFVTGKLEKVIWRKSDSTRFPKPALTKSQLNRLGSYKPVSNYEYTSGNFTYYLQNLGLNNVAGARHLVVVNNNNKQVELNRIYFDSEGTYLLPLNGVDEYSGVEGTQWTGAIFRFKPRMIMGFLGFSFGCPPIDFISVNEETIYIRCDNRH